MTSPIETTRRPLKTIRRWIVGLVESRIFKDDVVALSGATIRKNYCVWTKLKVWEESVVAYFRCFLRFTWRN